MIKNYIKFKPITELQCGERETKRKRVTERKTEKERRREEKSRTWRKTEKQEKAPFNRKSDL